MRHQYPIDRRQTYYYRHVEPVLKAVAISAIIGFAILMCLNLAGKI